MFGDYYRGKRVLVTGVTGVKGSWLAQFLLRAGASVVGLDRRAPSPDSNFCAAGLSESIEFNQGDVADLPLVQRLVNGVDAVFHLAAVALVREAKCSPFDTYFSNTLGTVAVLDAIRNSAKPVRAVFVTTDKVYQPKQGELWLETDPLGATGPYAVSKACAEFIIADYQRTYLKSSESRIGVGRAGNVVIGGDLNSSSRTQGGGRIFVDCFEALAQGRSPEIFSPNFTRPYTYGLDILSGYMTLLSQLDREGVGGEAFNFGPCEQYGVANSLIATKICDLWGDGTLWHSGQPREEPFEFQSLSIQKSQRLLGWRPVYTLYEALRDTAEWYRTWAALSADPTNGCMRGLNTRLFETYETAASRLGVRWASAN
jgi:CDP-glucose 4,6-dehydratase